MRCPWSFVLLAFVGLIGREALGQDPPRRAKGERYALVVGVRKYDPNELRALPYSEADANGLAKAFRDGGYKPDNVVLMTQTAGAEDLRFLPTADRIRKELNLLATDCQPDDTVLVALAGHGVQFRGETESYFCPADARLADRSTLLPLSEVYKTLERCPAGFKLMLVDACRNDPLSSNSRSRDVVDLESVSRPQAVQPPGGVSALFSCSAGEKAFEHDELKHGVFFHYVIQSLTGAAASGDGSEGMTLPEMEVFVKRNVRDFVRAKYGVRQMPERVGTERGLVPLVAFDPAGHALRKGIDYLNRGDYDAALTSLDEALRINPRLTSAIRSRGEARMMKLNHKGAVDDFNAVFRAGGADSELYRLRSAVYAGSGQFAWALADANEAMRLDPSNPKSYIQRARAYTWKGDQDLAIADYTQAARLNSKLSTIYIERGSIFSERGEHERALNDHTEAIRLNHKDASGYIARGVTYYRKREYERAIADYTEAIRLESKSVQAYRNRAEAHQEKGEFDLELADYTEAIKINPKSALDYCFRGLTYARKGDYSRALADVNEACRLDPNDAQFAHARATVYSGANRQR